LEKQYLALQSRYTTVGERAGYTNPVLAKTPTPNHTAALFASNEIWFDEKADGNHHGW
jgi:hypothetical protein